MSRKDWTDDNLIFRLVNNKSDKSRWENIRILRGRPGEELFIRCIELTESAEQKIRIIGIDILAQFGSPPRPFLQQTLKRYFDLMDTEKEPAVIRSILFAIGHNNSALDKTQIENICSFVHSGDTKVKEALVHALLGIDHPKAIETLIKLSGDKISHIRNWATFGLGSQIERDNQSIRDALWKRTNDKHQETKLEGLVGLAKRKDQRVKSLIKRELIHGKYGTLLFEAITETKDPEFIPLLTKLLKSLMVTFGKELTTFGK